MALAVLILKEIVFIALLMLIGQGVVGVFAWGRREQNPVYRLFRAGTWPLVRVTRTVTPKLVIDQHVPLVTFLVLLFAWVLLTFSAYPSACEARPDQPACEKWRAAQRAMTR